MRISMQEELPNQKSKGLHLRMEVKQSPIKLDNSSAFTELTQLLILFDLTDFPEFAIFAWIKINILR